MEYGPHQPVMLRRVVDALVLNSDGVYLDATGGGGGHSAEILSRLSEKGRVVAVDRDDDALKNLRERFADEPRFILVKGDFKDIWNLQTVRENEFYDGVLFDYGLSSHQIDTRERGFSFTDDGPLDMRMDRNLEISAETVVNDYEDAHLLRVLREFGEEPKAKKVVRQIVANRPVETTQKLTQIIKDCVPYPVQTKTLARVFQAIRIEVNGELVSIKEALPAAMKILKSGGRIVTLAYHSLEDRLVKEFFRAQSRGKEVDPYLPVPGLPSEDDKPPLKLITRKAILSDEQEIESNPRARSARMRVAEKN